MPSKVEYTMIDNGSERTRTQFYVATLTAANLVAQEGLADDVRVAINALSVLNEVELAARIVIHSAAAVPPSSALAQREYGVKLYTLDNTNGRAGHMFIPGVNSAYLPTNGDTVDLSVTQWAALKTALEATQSRDGNGLTLVKGIVTGRRN